MKAWRFYAFGDMRLDDVPPPPLLPRHVLVEPLCVQPSVTEAQLALGIPTLTIFGPTNEFETAPLGLRSELIRAEGIECARCMHRECPIDHRCMTRITVEAVAEKAFSLLEKL